MYESKIFICEKDSAKEKRKELINDLSLDETLTRQSEFSVLLKYLKASVQSCNKI